MGASGLPGWSRLPARKLVGAAIGRGGTWSGPQANSPIGAAPIIKAPRPASRSNAENPARPWRIQLREISLIVLAFLTFVDDPAADMVLQILADPRQVVDDLDAEFVEQAARPDPGKLQQLSGGDCSEPPASNTFAASASAA